MTAPRPGLPQMGPRLAALPLDERGYPVPFFVAYINGKPDFRVTDPSKLVQCVNQNLCWICGRRLGSYLVFTVGPMCAINRVSSEPPMHHECADFSVRACPFLSRPEAHRREANIPVGTVEPAGMAIRRNPGVTLLWTTRSYKVEKLPDGVLFRMGYPVATAWFSEGRTATLAEVMESIDTGYPILLEAAEREGRHSVWALEDAKKAAMKLLPRT